MRWGVVEITLFLRDGGIEVDNNRVEAIFRDVKLGLKNYLFVQSDLGGEAMAGFYSLIMTCEIHGVNPQDYIADILARIAAEHPSSGIDSLLPWNWEADSSRLKVESNETYFEQEYPPSLLIKKLGLEEKVYHDGQLDVPRDQSHLSEIMAQSP